MLCIVVALKPLRTVLKAFKCLTVFEKLSVRFYIYIFFISRGSPTKTSGTPVAFISKADFELYVYTVQAGFPARILAYFGSIARMRTTSKRKALKIDQPKWFAPDINLDFAAQSIPKSSPLLRKLRTGRVVKRCLNYNCNPSV